MSEIAIRAQNITKRYTSRKDQFAIQDISLEIPRGTLFGLVGPDGAGKTTTLRILSSVLIPTSGSVQVAGFDLHSNAEKARQSIGYMPQNFSLYPDLNVLENLNFFAQVHQVPAERKKVRIAEMLSFTRLEDFQKRRAAALSGGMKKKLALACAMIHNPKVLILDEPSTGVDPLSRRELWEILSNVVTNGLTVLVSTPYMDEAERCHQIGILYEGRLHTSGSPGELIRSLPFQIIEVKARPRKQMRQIVAETSGILDWRPVGDRLRLNVPNGEASKEVIASLKNRFSNEGLDVRLLQQTRLTTEDVFVHIVNAQKDNQ
ncbi:MAG: ABC transporter ATP-binding protein [Anaerolineales bacterium]|nr:ABC transporter ATP-binding protein [Anaerolineales bacterium]